MAYNPYHSDFAEALNKLKAQLQQDQHKRATLFNQQLNQLNQQGFGQLGSQTQNPQRSNLEQLNVALAAQRKLKPKPVSKEDRIKEIEHELDICRGVVPTPKGYKVDTSRVKSLVAELKQLQS